MDKNYDSFEELNVYKIAREIRLGISVLCKTFPQNEEYKLRDQIVRSSRSVTANIAEGHGRHLYKDNIRFCIMATGSMNETIDHLTVALNEKYINEQPFKTLKERIKVNIKVLNGYMNYLKKLLGVQNK